LDLPLDQIMTLFVGGTMQGVMDKARSMGADLPDAWLDLIYAQMFEALAERVEVIPGVREVLDHLDAAGIAYAIGSNGPHEKMEVTLGRTGLMPRFAGRIVSRTDVPNPKPAPDVYLRAAEICGVAPERAVVIDDSPSGARAGMAAGIVTFGFVAETDPARMTAHCDLMFDDMAKLPGLLGLS
jgi:HAD superfamily hydrolase (TIGR01509 family)